jgi:hypothetical protein
VELLESWLALLHACNLFDRECMTASIVNFDMSAPALDGCTRATNGCTTYIAQFVAGFYTPCLSHEWCSHACFTPSSDCISSRSSNLQVFISACQPLLFLTCHVIVDLSSVYYSGCMLSYADLMRPSRAETSRLKLHDPTCLRSTELVNG